MKYVIEIIALFPVLLSSLPVRKRLIEKRGNTIEILEIELLNNIKSPGKTIFLHNYPAKSIFS